MSLDAALSHLIAQSHIKQEARGNDYAASRQILEDNIESMTPAEIALYQRLLKTGFLLSLDKTIELMQKSIDSAQLPAIKLIINDKRIPVKLTERFIELIVSSEEDFGFYYKQKKVMFLKDFEVISAKSYQYLKEQKIHALSLLQPEEIVNFIKKEKIKFKSIKDKLPKNIDLSAVYKLYPLNLDVVHSLPDYFEYARQNHPVEIRKELSQRMGELNGAQHYYVNSHDKFIQKYYPDLLRDTIFYKKDFLDRELTLTQYLFYEKKFHFFPRLNEPEHRNYLVAGIASFVSQNHERIKNLEVIKNLTPTECQMLLGKLKDDIPSSKLEVLEGFVASAIEKEMLEGSIEATGIKKYKL